MRQVALVRQRLKGGKELVFPKRENGTSLVLQREMLSLMQSVAGCHLRVPAITRLGQLCIVYVLEVHPVNFTWSVHVVPDLQRDHMCQIQRVRKRVIGIELKLFGVVSIQRIRFTPLRVWTLPLVNEVNMKVVLP
jgi:hypothetical protein